MFLNKKKVAFCTTLPVKTEPKEHTDDVKLKFCTQLGETKERKGFINIFSLYQCAHSTFIIGILGVTYSYGIKEKVAVDVLY